MAEDNGSAGPQQKQSDGVDSARSEQGTLARHEYNIMAWKATEGVKPTRGAPVERTSIGTRQTKRERRRRRRGKKPHSARSPLENSTEETSWQGPP